MHCIARTIGPKRYVINNDQADHLLSFSLNTHHVRRPSVIVSELYLTPEQQLWLPSRRHTMLVELATAEGVVWSKHQPQMTPPPSSSATMYTSPTDVAGAQGPASPDLTHSLVLTPIMLLLCLLPELAALEDEMQDEELGGMDSAPAYLDTTPSVPTTLPGGYVHPSLCSSPSRCISSSSS
eukprot:TRINITY_DN221_c1_g1_i1.p1 TRINITY_DN221_c1_g1~~TRINITY_DN221_c1_g1_i1.p1  ORF type:complete len:181 (+),score=25.03 TRINITY_DN221_c1_g1_i1:451-993(+)